MSVTAAPLLLPEDTLAVTVPAELPALLALQSLLTGAEPGVEGSCGEEVNALLTLLQIPAMLTGKTELEQEDTSGTRGFLETDSNSRDSLAFDDFEMNFEVDQENIEDIQEDHLVEDGNQTNSTAAVFAAVEIKKDLYDEMIEIKEEPPDEALEADAKPLQNKEGKAIKEVLNKEKDISDEEKEDMDWFEVFNRFNVVQKHSLCQVIHIEKSAASIWKTVLNQEYGLKKDKGSNGLIYKAHNLDLKVTMTLYDKPKTNEPKLQIRSNQDTNDKFVAKVLPGIYKKVRELSPSFEIEKDVSCSTRRTNNSKARSVRVSTIKRRSAPYPKKSLGM